jgi:hypothetical protein
MNTNILKELLKLHYRTWNVVKFVELKPQDLFLSIYLCVLVVCMI